jgi:ATP-dependent Clp protease ATP-binding subunit ClpC
MLTYERSGSVFERFTGHALRVVATAQKESAALGHESIDDEHLLLALLNDPGSLATRALIESGVDIEDLRRRVHQAAGRGVNAPRAPRDVPFTARAKTTLDMSLREALQLHHDYIGTEHILLALLRSSSAHVAGTLLAAGADRGRVLPQIQAILTRDGTEHVGDGSENDSSGRS